MHLKFRNANDAFRVLVEMADQEQLPTVTMPSRAGDVVMISEPMTITYQRPRERAILNQGRDCNPFFHLFESIWMLAGCEDVDSVSYYNKRMREFSDDGETFHGAYGYRWRHQFGYDQVGCIIKELSENPTSRRCVLQMWDACVCDKWVCGKDGLRADKRHDLHTATHGGKDVPCNLAVTFQRDPTGSLNMTVFNRSNDLVWGALGANVVHFSYLQEYVANCVGCPVGVYNQISTNLHYYTERWTPKKFTDGHLKFELPPCPIPLVESQRAFDEQCEVLVKDTECCQYLSEPYLQRVVQPMMLAFRLHKQRYYKAAQEAMGHVVDEQWQYAGRLWLYKREKAWRKKNDENTYLAAEQKRIDAKACSDEA